MASIADGNEECVSLAVKRLIASASLHLCRVLVSEQSIIMAHLW